MSNSIEDILIRANKSTLESVVKFWKFHALSGTPIDEAKAIAAYKKMYDADDTEFVFKSNPYALQKEANRATSLMLGGEHKSFSEYQSILCVREMTSKVIELTGNIFALVQQEVESEFTGRNSSLFNRFRGGRNLIEQSEQLIEIARENGILQAKYKHINFIDFDSIIALDFLTKIGVVNDASIDCLIELVLSGVYGLTVFGSEKVVFLSLPKVSLFDGKIGSSKNLAIAFPDGYGLAMWKNLRIPNKYITEPITKEVIMNERNAEIKRCIKEMIGNDKFVELLDLTCIHEDFDNQENIMRLLRSKEKDPAIIVNHWSSEGTDGHLYFLHCTCPSTKREYYLSVKPTRDVWDAKASLFQNRPIQYRHGDCGILNLKKKFDRPIAES